MSLDGTTCRSELGALDRENPWPGLPPFREADQSFFHGRNGEIKELLDLLQRDRLTLLFGRSGLGKTSLLHAGLFPLLRKDGFLPVSIRLDFTEDSPPPTAQILTALQSEADKSKIEAPPVREGDTLWEYFHRHGADLWNDQNRPVAPVLVFDQLEELFTERGDAGVRKKFLADLAGFIEGRSPAEVDARLKREPSAVREFAFRRHFYKVLLSLREDFLPELESWRTAMPALLYNRLRLRPMNGIQALDAIVMPGGHLLEEESVAEKVIRSIARTEIGEATPLVELEVGPSLLSLFCRELNKKRQDNKLPKVTANLVDVSKQGIVKGFYEDCLLELDPKMRPAIRIFIEDELVTGAGYRASVPEDDALGAPGVTQEALEILLNLRLLQIEDRPGVKRYELAHDVLTDVVRASRETRQQREALDRAQAEVRQKTRQVALLGVLLVLTVLVAAVLVLALRKEEQARQAKQKAWKAERATDMANANARKALVSSDLREATEHFQNGQPVRELAHLARALRLQPDNASATERLLDRLLRHGWHYSLAVFLHQDDVRSAEISPDGRRVVTSSHDGTARLWDATTGATLGEPMRHGDFVLSAAFSPDGRLLVTASADGSARIWDGSTAKPFIIDVLKHGSRVHDAKFSPDGRRIVTASSDGTARIWALDFGQRVATLMPWVLEHEAEIFAAQFSHDGKWVVTASRDQTVRIWDASSGEQRGRPLQHAGWVFSAEFSPDDRILVTASGDGAAHLWDVPTGTQIGAMAHRPREQVRNARFSQDGTMIVTASWDGTARIWDGRSGRPRTDFLRHEGRVLSSAISADGRFVATASADGTARIWSTRTGVPVGEPVTHQGWVHSVRFSRDDQSIVTASSDGTARLWRARVSSAIETTFRQESGVHEAVIDSLGEQVLTAADKEGVAQVWDVRTGRPIGVPIQHGAWISMGYFAPDGRTVVTAAADHTIRLWDTKTGQPLLGPFQHTASIRDMQFTDKGGTLVTATADGTTWSWNLHTGEGTSVAHSERADLASFSPDGRRVVFVDRNNFQIWDLIQGRPVGRRGSHEGYIKALHFRLDGKQIATSSLDGMVRIWSADDGRRLLEKRREGVIDLVRFSPDGQYLVAVSGKQAQIRETERGRLVDVIEHGGKILCAEFSPDSRWLITGAIDRTARLWEVRSGAPLGEPLLHGGEVRSVQFSLDGRRVVTSSADGTARVWFGPQHLDFPKDAHSLSDLAELAGGYRVDDVNDLVPLENPADLWAGLRRLVPSQEFLRWLLADPWDRTISPQSRIKVGDYIQYLLSNNSLADRKKLLGTYPGHPRFDGITSGSSLTGKAGPSSARQAPRPGSAQPGGPPLPDVESLAIRDDQPPP